MTGERGVALVMAVLLTAFLSALGLGLMLALFMDRLATGNMGASMALLYAADAGVELAARDLARAADVDAALTGTQLAEFIDGPAQGVRTLPGGGALDLTAMTNQLNCGKDSACTAAQMDANSTDRPWGTNNARWQLYAFGRFADLAPLARPVPCYLVVWIADDGREADGDPLTDAAASGAPGHGIVRVRAEAFGLMGARRVVEAELARVCPDDEEEACLPGIRVQSWQERRAP